jgi:hypothetical protein
VLQAHLKAPIAAAEQLVHIYAKCDDCVDGSTIVFEKGQAGASTGTKQKASAAEPNLAK